MAKISATLGLAALAPLADLGLNDTLNLGTVIVASLVLVFGGIFTLRSNVANTWKDNYFAEKEGRENAEREAKEQRELKHTALNEAAGLRLKTDLTALMKFLEQSRELYDARFAQMEQHNQMMAKALSEQAVILVEISKTLQRIGA